MRVSWLMLCKHAVSAGTGLLEKELSVQAPWGKIAVLTWGEASRKPVLMVHGKIDSAAVFRPLVHLLPRDFYYIGVELPGNGRSEPLPKGVPISVLDFVPTVKAVVDQLQLTSFSFIGHSLGSVIGKYYHAAYPGGVDSMVDLDPLPGHLTFAIDNIGEWYHYFYGSYFSPETYGKYNAPAATAPLYTREKALQMTMENRGLTMEAAEIALERNLEPAGNGLYRFTYDQRMKRVMLLPFSAGGLRELYTGISIPTLSTLASETIDGGWYEVVPFVRDESAYKHGTYRVVTVEGNHDVHLSHPERLAGVVGKFLKENAAV